MRSVVVNEKTIECKEVSAICHVVTNQTGNILVKGYSSTKKQIADFYYCFPSEDKANAFIEKFFQSIKDRKASKEQRKAQAKQDALKLLNQIKVGDIFCNSWGYEQTNVDFFQITNIKGHKIFYRSIAQEISRDAGFMSEYVLPVANKFTGEEKTKIVRSGYLGMSSWNGKEKYQSHYA